MKKQYVFGYLFVRFAKLISALVVLAALATCALHTLGHLNTLSSLKYVRDAGLNEALTSLADELAFVRKEAGRFGYKDDGKVITISPAPAGLGLFRRTEGELEEVRGRVNLVKNGVTASFVDKVTDLRNRIRTAIAEIEALRGLPESKLEVTEPAKVPSRPLYTNPAAPFIPQKTLFGFANGSANERSRVELAEWSLFFKSLREKAERKENQELIDSLLAEFEQLRAMFPEVSQPKAASPAPHPVEKVVQGDTPAVSKPSQPEDPLVTALSNMQSIESAMVAVLALTHEGWAIDAQLERTVQLVRQQKSDCIAKQTARNAAWVSWAKQVGLAVLSGAVTAFFILVFADFIQSFFDTSVNTGRTAFSLEAKSEDSA